MRSYRFLRYWPFIVFYCLCYALTASAKTTRTIEISPGMVSEVHTSLGYSTIVEFSSKPTQAVLGDQDAFKLEYIGNSITLKPLLPRAKSNLFVFTDLDRYSFSVDTVSSGSGDYLVRIRNKFTSVPVLPEKKTKLFNLQRRSTKNGVTVEAQKIDLSILPDEPRESSIIHFSLLSDKNEYSFQPASLGMRQGSRFVSIESIYLDALEIGPQFKKVRGTLVLLNEDWNRALPLTLVFALKPQRPQKKDFRIETLVWSGKKKGGADGKPAVPEIFKLKKL